MHTFACLAFTACAALACAACTRAPDDVQDARGRDAGAALADASVADMASAGAMREGTVTHLKSGDSANIAGVTVTFGGTSHKSVGPGQSSPTLFHLELARDGAPTQTRYWSLDDDALGESELDALGTALVVRRAGHDALDVTLVAARAPAALDPEACLARVMSAAADAGQAAVNERGWTNADGIVTVRTDAWTGYCGRYTQRVWFAKR